MFEFLGIESLSDIPTALPSSSQEWTKETPYLVNGVIVSIEYLTGDVRRKPRADGAVISNMFHSAYGEILNTTDRTGERLDVYLAEPYHADAEIYIIDQVDPQSRVFDEHKLLFGFASQEAALAAYTAIFADQSGLIRIGAFTTFNEEQFTEWMSNSDNLLVPASFSSIAGLVIAPGMSPIKMPMAPETVQSKPRSMVRDGAVVIALPKGKPGVTVHAKARGEKGMTYHVYIYGPIFEEHFIEHAFHLERLLEDATEDDQFIFHISTPGGDVITGGVVTSAMRATAADVITIAEGPVCSCGVTIWAEGKTRQIDRGAFFMQHMTNGGMSGSTGTLAEKITFVKDYVLSYMSRLVHLGLFTQEEVTNMVDREAEIFISSEEAIHRVGGALTHG